MEKTKYIFISNGYRGGASNFLIDHVNYLSKRKKNILLIDDNPPKTFGNISNLIKIKKIKTNHFSYIENEKLKKVLFKKGKKIVFITNYAFLIKYYFLFLKFKKKNIKIILTIHSGLFNLSLKNLSPDYVFH